MFDKLSQLKQLKEMESALAKEEATVEKDGVKVTVNGKMEIKEVRLNPEAPAGGQGEIVKDCLNEAMRKIQIEAAKKMFQR
jgi:DNA-binding protein YbaB